MIGALILGLVAGVVGRALVRGDALEGLSGPTSWLASIAVGLVGSFVGYFIFRAIGIGDDDAFDLGGLLGAILGVVLVLMALKLLVGGRGGRARTAA